LAAEQMNAVHIKCHDIMVLF